MAVGYYRRPGGVAPHGGQRAQAIKIYLRHHNDPEKKFQPTQAVCETDEAKGRVGCGGSIFFYITYPNQKRMPFDGPPVVVDGSEVQMGDGGVVAQVYTDNVHFATCPAKKKAEPVTSGFVDARSRAAGE